MTRLLVIARVSVHRLHLDGGTITSTDGPAIYTTMAAHRCGARVTLFGLRPEPCPEALEPVAERLAGWLGPPVPPDQLPHREFSHQAGITKLLNLSSGAEPALSPDRLPEDLSPYDLVHVAPQSGVDRQLSFLHACRQRGAAWISAATESHQVRQQPAVLRALLEASDLLFTDQEEVGILFGSLQAAQTPPGKLLFVDLGARGACVVQGATVTLVPGIPAHVADPIGADDAFCGATLAFLLYNEHPIMAARRAVALVAERVGQMGLAPLLSGAPPPEVPLDPRVCIDEERVRRVTGVVATVAEAKPYPWVGPTFPPVDHPSALEWMFAATLQQFSFWTVRDSRYHLPLIAPIGGVERKGSDYLYFAITRRLQHDPGFCSPERQASLTREELLATFRADNGEDPMPAFDLHLEQARSYGRDMLAQGLTPQSVVQRARATVQPLRTLQRTLDHVAGYKEDPLRKLTTLLAMGLDNRPERFLPLRDDESLPPIMDYHLMRSCLRLGLIEVVDGDLRAKLVGRQVVSPEEEWAVRYAAYLAYGRFVAQSGRHPDDLNGFVFGNARRTCLEMTEPQCHACLLDPVCAHYKEYFQPVIRTTFY